MADFPYFKGRINRRDFILGMFFFNLLYFLVYGITLLFFFQKHSFQELKSMDTITATFEIGKFFNISTFPGIFFNAFGLIIVLASLGVCIKRFHDIGRSGKLVALIPLTFIIRMFFAHIIHFFLTNSIIPSHSDILLFKFSDYLSIIVGLIIIYLATQPGQEHKNRYGDVSVNSGFKKIILS
jgi:uncharacterized membrane protein YhaH (DUF805 family)